MDKKSALIILLENSFWIADEAKIFILKNINKMGDEQITLLGKMLAEERQYMITHKDEVLHNSEKLLNTVKQAIDENEDSASDKN
jgi:hypothetical protein